MTASDTILLDVMARRWATALAKTTHVSFDDLYQQSALALLEARASGVSEEKITIAAYRDVLDYIRSEWIRRPQEAKDQDIESPAPSPVDVCIAKEIWCRLTPQQQQTLLHMSAPKGDATTCDRFYKRRSRARMAVITHTDSH